MGEFGPGRPRLAPPRLQQGVETDGTSIQLRIQSHLSGESPGELAFAEPRPLSEPIDAFLTAGFEEYPPCNIDPVEWSGVAQNIAEPALGSGDTACKVRGAKHGIAQTVT